MLVNGVEVNMDEIYERLGGSSKVAMLKEVRAIAGGDLSEINSAVDNYFKESKAREYPEEVSVLNASTNKDQKVQKEESIMEMVGANGILTLYQNRIVIKRRGIRGLIGHGMFQGEKEILLSSITGIQLKKAGLLLVGYIQFSVLGGNEGKKGLTEATQDENTVTIDMSENKIAEQIKDKIYELQKNQQSGGNVIQNNIQQLSGADEILKYKNLLEAGILTQDEFDAKKKQLLGL